MKTIYFRCPKCGAKPGFLCVTLRKPQTPVPYHAERRNRAKTLNAKTILCADA